MQSPEGLENTPFKLEHFAYEQIKNILLFLKKVLKRAKPFKNQRKENSLFFLFLCIMPRPSKSEKVVDLGSGPRGPLP